MTEQEWIDSAGGVVYRVESRQPCSICGNTTDIIEDVGVAVFLCSRECQATMWQWYYRNSNFIHDGYLAVAKKEQISKDN